MSAKKRSLVKWGVRKKASHKGNYGRIFILAASEGLTGAAHLTSLAALRTGAGLVTLGIPSKVYTVLARRSAEVMVKPFTSTPEGSLAFKALPTILKFSKNQDVLALGPGLSTHPSTQKLIRSLLMKSVQPLVIDADGLNALKGHFRILKGCGSRAIITPHPGEFVRVFGGKLDSTDRNRKERAKDASRESGAVVVLKGHRTVVASPWGEVHMNETGNPGMATGGTGDVLTGMIAALLGQNFSLWDAARAGVYLHGLAGDLASRKTGEISLIAGDIVEFLPQAIKKVNRRSSLVL